MTTITKHVWPDGVYLWALSEGGEVTSFFWTAQQAADYAQGKTITWKTEHHEH